MPLDLDTTTTLNPAPTPTSRINSAELHFRYGNGFIEVDVQAANGQTRRYKTAINGSQQTTLENAIAAVIKNTTGATTVTFTPDPPPGG